MTRLSGWLEKHGAWAVVVIAIAIVAVVRLRIGAAPLERDEGEYAYAGQLILRGIPPYQQVYNMKFPGVYYAYALILAIFGETPLGIHSGLLIVNAATTLVVFAIGRRLSGDPLAATAAVAFALLSVDRSVMGVFAHATHFVLLPALGAFLLLLRDPVSRSRRHVFWSGVLLGIAVLMKQHAVIFCPLAGALLFVPSRSGTPARPRAIRAHVALLALGAALPFVAIGALFYAQGVLPAFWFWTIRYAAAYVAEVPASAAWGIFGKSFAFVTSMALPFWIVAGAGLVAVWLTQWNLRTRVFVTGLAAASMLAVCPGFYFRPHYFILMLPAIALATGVAVVTLARLLRRVVSRQAGTAIAAAAFAALIASYAWPERAYLFTMDGNAVNRSIYGTNPFIEAPEIAKYIRERTQEGDRIAVLGSEPEIFFYAGRMSATAHIYTYPLVEGQPYAARMQDEMIRQIEAAGPKYVVFVQVDPSWLVGRQSNIGIVEWGNRYVQACFDPVGIADMDLSGATTMVWGDDAARYAPTSPNVIYTFRKKSDALCTIMR
jgi:4-amino-4-deoxy-L-arabinose transferase-like glycosyltransferase